MVLGQYINVFDTELRKSMNVDPDTGRVVKQVGSVALKPAWRNYSALELETTWVVWTLETLAYYLKGCPEWTNHLPLVQSLKKEVRELTHRMQGGREAGRPFKPTTSFCILSKASKITSVMHYQGHQWEDLSA